MRKSFLILACLACPFLISAQTDSNSITVTASRNPNLQADQIVFGVSVISGLNATFDDVLGALQGSGIALANFTGVTTGPYYGIGVPQPASDPNPVTPAAPAPTLQWSFILPVPLSKIKDTIGTLTTVQQNVAKKNNWLTVTFQVQGTQVSAQSQQSQACALSDLIADARAQAQKLADAAGMGVGVILAMSGATYGVTPISVYSSWFSPSGPNCTLTVKFALQRF
jgi:hypothetical protein